MTEPCPDTPTTKEMQSRAKEMFLATALRLAGVRQLTFTRWIRIAQTLLTILLLSLLLPSQQLGEAKRPLRQWIIGKVLRVDGAPWASGEVTLLSHSWRIAPDNELADRVVVQCNDRGMFRAAVQPGRVYVVWCQSEVENRIYSTTQLVTASAGTPVTLRESEDPRCVVELQLKNTDPWQAQGPLCVEAIGFVGARIQAPCDDLGAGRFRLPRLPVPSPYVRIMTKNRIPLLSGAIPLRKQSRLLQAAARSKPSFQKRPLRVESAHGNIAILPDPQAVHIEITSLAGPVAGARLTYCDRTDHRLWAQSDAQGKAQLLVPRVLGDKSDDFLRYLSFWVQGEAVTTVHAYAFDLRIPKDGGAIKWKLELPTAFELRGRLMWTKGKPAANVRLQLHTGAPGGQSFGGRGASFGGFPQCVCTDAEGRFVVPGRTGILGYQLSMFMRDREISQLPPAPLPYSPFVVLSSGLEANGQHTELGDIVLSEYVPVDVVVTGDDGQPAASHAIHFRERLDADLQEKRVCYTRVDWQGRIRLLARPGSELQVSAMANGDADDIGPSHSVAIAKGRQLSVDLKARTKN